MNIIIQTSKKFIHDAIFASYLFFRYRAFFVFLQHKPILIRMLLPQFSLQTFACKCLTVAAISMAATSCTLNEPESINGNGTSGRLQSISFFGQDAVYMKYDGQGRVTDVAMPFYDTKIMVRYNPLNMTVNEYDTYSNNDDKDVYKLCSSMEWTNMRTDASGNVISADITETTYYYDFYNSDGMERVTTEVDKYSHILRYDAEGHLIFISDADNEQDSEYKWVNGCLVEGNNTNEEYFTCEYSDIDNITGQWTPFWGATSMFQMTGLFGKAPAKMIKAIYSDFGYNKNSIRFSYKLNNSGQISVMQFNDSEEGTVMSLMFTYK